MTRRNASRRWLVPLCLALLLGGLALPAALVSAATQHVTDCGDAGANTLRGLIGSAGVGDTIVFDQDCTITLATGPLTLTQNVTINGTGHTVVVDGGCVFNQGTCRSTYGVQDFVVNNGVTASLTALTIQHGHSMSSGGGGILNNGTLSLTNSAVSANTAIGGSGIANIGTLSVTNSTISANHYDLSGGNIPGGGIANDGGTLTVTNSTVSGNTAGGDGGGISNSGGTLTVTNSTISGNTVGANGQGDGGGIFHSGGTTTVANSTVSGNSAPNGNGGGIENAGSGTITVTNSTVSGNSAGFVGGGIVNFTLGTTTVRTTIIAGNTATVSGPDAYDVNAATPFTSGGGNLIGIAGAGSGNTTFTAAGDQTGTVATPLNPLLGPLATAGGPTQTLPPQSGSPAINAIAPGSNCPATYHDPISNTNVSVTTDQRGIHRPQGTNCDKGAVEVATYTLSVNSANDGTADPNRCLVGNANTCTLRNAIATVNGGLVPANPTPTITFGATVSTVTLTPTAGALTLTQNVTIDGTGHTIVVDGGCTANCTSEQPVGGVTVFVVNSGVTASLSALTIQHGATALGACSAPPCSGGILNAGTLTVASSTIFGNYSVYGGGINNVGTLTVTNSTISGNGAIFGGGIYNDHSTLTVTNSTLSGNSADTGGIDNSSGTVTVTNTIIAGNGADIGGTITTGGHNLFGSTSGASITLGPGDLVNPNPLLGPLGNNGGPTQTVPLLQGSPAIDAGSDAVCAAALVGGKDQRGIARPVGAHCDIGAFETGVINPVPAPKPTVPAGGAPNPLPAARPPGTTSGPAPNPLPAPRP
jgi:hypothetical protein